MNAETFIEIDFLRRRRRQPFCIFLYIIIIGDIECIWNVLEFFMRSHKCSHRLGEFVKGKGMEIQ